MIQTTIQTIIQTLKQTVVPFIECCIFSSIWILFLFWDLSTVLPILEGLLNGENVQIGLSEEARISSLLFMISVLIAGLIIYFVLKKKHNFKIKIFFYGIGFVLCSFIMFTNFLMLMERIFDSYGTGIPLRTSTTYARILLALSFTLFYYAYATLLQNNNKEINKDTLRLTALAVIPFAALIIIEIIKYQNLIFGVSLLFVIPYFICCLIFANLRISPQILAWCFFLSSYTTFLGVILTASLL